MQILMNTGGIATTNCFVIADEIAKVAVLFDAPDHTVSEILDEVKKRGWDLIGLWFTHAHFDHIADHAIVTEKFPNAKVLIHSLEEPRLQEPNSSVFVLPFTIPARSADGHLSDEQILKIGEIELRVMHTPGHSPGHVMFYSEKHGVLVGGDLIIGGSVGRTDLPGADVAAMEKSVRAVMQLPDETKLLPGHGQPASIGHERKTNPYVREIINDE